MAKISRDSNLVELDGPPMFDYGDKVIARFNIRNDGTYRGRDIGDLLVKKGDVGYVSSIGTFIQQFYIYGVDFYERGTLVGMRSRELLEFDPQAENVTDKVPEKTSEKVSESEDAHV